MECQLGANFCTEGLGLTGFGLVTDFSSVSLKVGEHTLSDDFFVISKAGFVGGLGLVTRGASRVFQLAGSTDFGLVGSGDFIVELFEVVLCAESRGFQDADSRPFEEMASLIVDTTWAPVVISVFITAPW